MARSPKLAPVVVIYGEDDYGKFNTLERVLNALLPPKVDRALALCLYDGGQTEERGGPSGAGVMDDLATLPLLSERRVVLVRDADRFISAHRGLLEKYCAAPTPTSTLVLICRSFPRNTRLAKIVETGGGQIHECKRLTGKALVGFAMTEAAARGKRLDQAAAQRLCGLVSAEAGVLSAEVEKLALYVGDRPAITERDILALVGQTREEMIFAAMDMAGFGRPAEALRLWHQVLASDPEAAYKAVGGVAFVLRKWLTAQRLRAQGLPVEAIAPKVMLWGRAPELAGLLRRLPTARLGRLVASLAELDAQAKSGLRSIERGVEALLLEVAGLEPRSDAPG